jgi:hypothetical protein
MAAELYRMMPGRPTSLPTSLKSEQVTLLHEIASPFVKNGGWPIWHYVSHRMDQHGLDAREIAASLPRFGATGLGGLSYGFTSAAEWRTIGEAEKIGLTVAAALPLEELRPLIAEPFLRVLHHMIKLQRDTVPLPDEVIQTWLDSKALAAAIPSLSPSFITLLPDILSGEPGTWGGSSAGPNPPDDLSWRREIRRDVLKYVEATDLPNYVDTVCRLISEHAQRQAKVYGSTPPMVPEQGQATVAEPSGERYVKQELISELGELDDVNLSTAKLVEFLSELNFCYLHRKPLACGSLLRAIIDHVPPGFGATTFAEVVSGRPWGSTDTKYLNRLRDFRDPANDVLHRQMGKRRSRIDMDDIPAPAAVNALLDGLVVALRDRKA